MAKITESTFIVLDTETTGPDTSSDKPIEIAIVRLENMRLGAPKSWFVNPQRPIPPEASAVHHLVDADVESAPTLEELWGEVMSEIGDAVILAHNAPFDLAMLPGLSGNKSLCTLRLAKHLWQRGEKNARGFPLANHQQQVLRYWLGLQVDTQGLAAHRAAADILVTGELFKSEVERFFECGGEDSLEDLMDLAARRIEVAAMPFGKFAGEPIDSIRPDYLEYLLAQSEKKPMDEDLKASIKKSLDRRKAEAILESRGGASAAP